MKNITPIAILLVLTSVLLTSCGKPEEFVPAPVITTGEATTEAVTYKYSNLDVLGAKMGMSIEETQNALGVKTEIQVNDSAVPFFAIKKSGLPFVSEGVESMVYFIFDYNMRLCEIQYATSEKTGFVLKDAISTYDKKFGKHAEVKYEENKTNYVWYQGGVYIIVTTTKNSQSAISFFDENYFAKSNPEEVKAYAQA